MKIYTYSLRIYFELYHNSAMNFNPVILYLVLITEQASLFSAKILYKFLYLSVTFVAKKLFLNYFEKNMLLFMIFETI